LFEQVADSSYPSDRKLGSASRERENAWVEASKNGDHVAFNRLVLFWEKRIYNLVYRMLHDPEEAADTTQEVFLAAFRNIQRFRQSARFSTWLYRIAVNKCLSRLRRRPAVFHSIEDEQAGAFVERRLAAPGQQDEEVLRLEHSRQVRASLSALSDRQRAVVELKVFQEETFETIAEILGVPQSTVKSRFYASLDILKGRLKHLVEESHG
jgi:RNA polymerase sigma-70 factor (ECF subfamily)